MTENLHREAVLSGRLPFCACGELELGRARREKLRWGVKQLTWFVAGQLPGMSLLDQVAAYGKAFRQWEDVCDLQFDRTEKRHEANFVILAKRIDGPNGTLAYHELPPTNRFAGQLRGTFDTGESWTPEFLLAVACHEIGHGLGLSHEQSRKVTALMDPFYNPEVTRPQPWDIEQVVARYGKPRPSADPAPEPPSDPGKTKQVTIEITLPADAQVNIRQS